MTTGFKEIVEKYATPNMVVAEVGVWEGGSAIHVAPIVKQYQGQYLAIDWFYGSQFTYPPYVPEDHNSQLDKFISNIKQADCDDVIEIFDMTTLQAAEQIEDESIDICYIDADHIAPHPKNDILAYTPKIKSGGILCGHDLEWGHINRFNQFTSDELTKDYIGCHPGVIQAVGETIGFDLITMFPMNVWAVRINHERQYEKL